MEDNGNDKADKNKRKITFYPSHNHIITNEISIIVKVVASVA
jgi:hypothetical protein